MKEYMNEPVDFSWSDADIVEAYSGNSEDKRSIKRVFCLTTKELNRILREAGVE